MHVLSRDACTAASRTYIDRQPHPLIHTYTHPPTHPLPRRRLQVGIANYAELAKGQMLGGMDGFLKIIFSTEDFRILGVHAIGEGATEIVHIGQVRACGWAGVRATCDGCGGSRRAALVVDRRAWMTQPIHVQNTQVVMAAGGSVKYFVDAVFNYPTLAEAYNVAAQNGLRNMGIFV